MELRQNILFSLVIHAIIIIAVFIVSSWNRFHHAPTGPLIVTLFEEMKSKAPNPYSTIDNKKYHHLPLLHSEHTGERIQTILSDKNKMEMRNKEKEQDKKEEIISASARNDNNIFASYKKITRTGLDDNTKTAAGTFHELPQFYDYQDITDQGEGSGENTVVINIGTSTTKNFQGSKVSSPYDLIRASIEKAKTYPSLARKRRSEGTVMTAFTINSKGYPENIKVEKSSGSEILDSEAIKIVMRAAPLPKVKDKIVVSITFKLTGSSSMDLLSR
jgi:TonB family protein